MQIDWWQILDFFSFISFIFIGWQALKGLLFWLWLWQLKEYRFDRIRIHFKLPIGRKQLLNFFNLFLLGEWRLPRLNLRILLSFFFVCFLNYNLYFFLLKLSSFIVRLYPNLLFFAFTFVLLIIFLFLPITASLVTFAFSFMLWPIKELIVLLAKKRIESLKPLVIGITGSFGKTSTKFILDQALSSKFNVLITPKSVNTPLGIAKTILFKLRKHHEIFIVEMGAYKLGEIKKLCWLVSPKIGILTGINNQHQALFGSFSNIKKAKYELIKSLPKDGLAIFNYQNSTSRSLGKLTKRVAVKFYGRGRNKYKTKLLGKAQQVNIDAARVVASFFKIPLKKTLSQINKLIPQAGMLQERKGVNNSKILDDSFNANPEGFLQGLKILASFKNKKKILITPGVIELGRGSEKIHKNLAQKADEVANLVVLTDENFYKIFKKQVKENKLYLICEKRDFSQIKKQINRSTVILLEGRVPGHVKERVIL